MKPLQLPQRLHRLLLPGHDESGKILRHGHRRLRGRNDAGRHPGKKAKDGDDGDNAPHLGTKKSAGTLLLAIAALLADADLAALACGKTHVWHANQNAQKA